MSSPIRSRSRSLSWGRDRAELISPRSSILGAPSRSTSRLRSPSPSIGQRSISPRRSRSLSPARSRTLSRGRSPARSLSLSPTRSRSGLGIRSRSRSLSIGSAGEGPSSPRLRSLSRGRSLSPRASSAGSPPALSSLGGTNPPSPVGTPPLRYGSHYRLPPSTSPPRSR